MIEEYDRQIMDSRDTPKYRHKRKEMTTIKAKTGLVEYRRTKYIEKQEDGNEQEKLYNIKDFILG